MDVTYIKYVFIHQSLDDWKEVEIKEVYEGVKVSLLDQSMIKNEHFIVD